nr:glycine-rich protein 1-like [Aegilops tauschii subsp. strangulata]
MNDVGGAGIPSSTSCTTGGGAGVGAGGAGVGFFLEVGFFAFGAAAPFGPREGFFLTFGAAAVGATAGAGWGRTTCWPARRLFEPTATTDGTSGTDGGSEDGVGAGVVEAEDGGGAAGRGREDAGGAAGATEESGGASMARRGGDGIDEASDGRERARGNFPPAQRLVECGLENQREKITESSKHCSN